VRRLPGSLDELRGLRAARWIRESTAGQADNFGPDAQREQQDQAISRWALADTELAWSIAHSGRTIASTSAWSEMLAAAGDRYDVLVVGYASRFARDLRSAVNARHDLHAAGAAILFADERLLSSDEDAWEGWAREAVEAEAYSRRLGKRIREGYAAKRRRLGIPGGNRAPLGVKREGRRLSRDADALAVVQRAFDLASGGATDRDVSLQLGLAPKHVAEILTNRFYRGELRTGEPSALGPLIDPATWELVQALRSRYSRRHRGSIRRRQYALSGLIACSSCGRRLIGHSGRYRHVEACEPFRAAAPRRLRRFHRAYDRRTKGESYPIERYEDAIAAALERVAVGAELAVDVVARSTAGELSNRPTDALAQLRIGRERESAAARYVRDRDLARLEATMRRLDQEAAAAADVADPVPSAAEVHGYLEDLPRLWAETTDVGRRAIAEATFERIEATGGLELAIALTPAAIAHGWDVAFGTEPLVVGSIDQSGRGERI
jgi:DNA invertase Pin-like site-specific DNA recombinase